MDGGLGHALSKQLDCRSAVRHFAPLAALPTDWRVMVLGLILGIEPAALAHGRKGSRET